MTHSMRLAAVAVACLCGAAVVAQPVVFALPEVRVAAGPAPATPVAPAPAASAAAAAPAVPTAPAAMADQLDLPRVVLPAPDAPAAARIAVAAPVAAAGGGTAQSPAAPARQRLEAAASRLRCWQHGVAVLDEAFTGTANLPAGSVFSIGPAGSQRLLVFGQGTGLCSVTNLQERASAWQ